MTKLNIMLKYISILSLIIHCISCSNTSNKNSKDISIEQIKLTSSIQSKYLYTGYIWYRPIYLGNKQDSINIDSVILNLTHFPELSTQGKHSIDPTVQISKNHHPDSNDIRIFVDTSQSIPNLSNSIPLIQDINAPFHVASYPIFIENISLDTLFIGSSIGMPLHLQILSPNHTWKKTNQFVPGCGTGEIPYLLCPHSIVIIPHPITKGNFRTTFRFAYGYSSYYSNEDNYIYSNEFYGTIDSSFFQ